MREVSSPIYQAVKVEGPSFPTFRASQKTCDEFLFGEDGVQLVQLVSPGWKGACGTWQNDEHSMRSACDHLQDCIGTSDTSSYQLRSKCFESILGGFQLPSLFLLIMFDHLSPAFTWMVHFLWVIITNNAWKPLAEMFGSLFGSPESCGIPSVKRHPGCSHLKGFVQSWELP